ncbi:AAA family ATPase [Cupriavidus necator]
MIERIDIPNFGCYANFAWNTEVRDPGNNVARFKKMNVIYGRNYSGKTTLSRIIRSLETGVISSRYDAPAFTLTLSTGTLSASGIPIQGHDVRVYNKDFVDEHLAFLRVDDGDIVPFAILGLQNKEIEAEIDKLEAELGSVDSQTGLRHRYQEHKKAHAAKLKLAKDAKDELEKRIFDKANKHPTGIKHNPLYRDANYDVRKLRADMQAIQTAGTVPVDEGGRAAAIGLLGEAALPDIKQRLAFSPALAALEANVNRLISKKIQPSAPIQALLDDAILQQWVKTGVALHQPSRSTCAFCGSPLPPELWKKLGDHFNQESQDLEQAIAAVQADISSERARIANLVTISRQGFYLANQATFDELGSQLGQALAVYARSLATLESELEARRGTIFTARPPVVIDEHGGHVLATIAAINALIELNNEMTASLAERQTRARNDLRRSEVAQFVADIGMADETARIKALNAEAEETKTAMDGVAAEGRQRSDRIQVLRTQLRDEKRGAEQVNQFLGHFMGHGGLRLAAVEDADTATYRFQILRGDQPAYNLSEGECSLVAFCYFLAKLEDIDTKGKKLIIYIDDPISSLDSNHIFFVFSLIESYLARPMANAAGMPLLDTDNKPIYRYEQLFISTHNLEFLKYLKRLTKPAKDSESFLITKKETSSSISLMPHYLRNYVTELNYLFGEIYGCADAGNANKHYHSFYNFGNNLRKFLESFLYFKYPFYKSDHDQRIKLFFADGTNSEALVQRLTNEFSHLGEFIDRGAQPIDCAEIASVAKFVLKKLRDNDPQQFDHFLLSIEKPDPFAAV